MAKALGRQCPTAPQALVSRCGYHPQNLQTGRHSTHFRVRLHSCWICSYWHRLCNLFMSRSPWLSSAPKPSYGSVSGTSLKSQTFTQWGDVLKNRHVLIKKHAFLCFWAVIASYSLAPPSIFPVVQWGHCVTQTLRAVWGFRKVM